MSATSHPLHSLEAWPGESQQPPLRLLETPRTRAGTEPASPIRSRPAGWLQRLRRALAR
ncbi:MAG TPA: hypothetical protein VFY73_27055 [Ideonella sp.]|uniref:hypothetical protein n=1 Tax=Ideonella sp. TaxID=1929293 RepID=UPI002E34392F|nr:hypothetical protein [Ideonella sp.]HEX5687690.1 hypothetical protein [Ideonella sp.]